MMKHRIEYDSPLDALIVVTKRLSALESRYQMSSEDFFDQYAKGRLQDEVDFVEWANDYRHMLALKLNLQTALRHAA